MDVLQFALKQVNTAFPGVFNIPLADASKFIGVSPKTIRNQLSLGCAPFLTVARGGLRYVPAPALAAVVAADIVAAGVDVSGFGDDDASTQEPVKRGRRRRLPQLDEGEVAA